jgi:hypothetical protein
MVAIVDPYQESETIRCRDSALGVLENEAVPCRNLRKIPVSKADPLGGSNAMGMRA